MLEVIFWHASRFFFESMSDWKKCKLGDIIELQRGYDLPHAKRCPGDYPIVSSSGITGTHSVYKVNPPGVVTGRYGTIGEVFYTKACFWPLNTTLFVSDFKGNFPRFVYYLLQLFDFQRFCEKSTVPGINRNDLYPTVIKIPLSIKKQKLIAQVLSSLDEKIDLNRQLNDNLEAMAQALYDYWFVQFDFPDANGKPYKSSGGKMVWNEVLKREIPAGWSCGQLGDIIQANPTEHLNKGAVAPYIAMEALSTTRFLTDEPEKKAYAGGMKFRNKDILIARITPCLENGKTALVHDLKDKEVGFGSTEYIVIRGKLFSLPTFCICLARSKEFRTYAISKMTGTSGRRRLDYKDVEAYKQPIPPASLLCKFENWGAGVLDKMHKTLVQNRILEKQRDFLLPLLMNGQVQVRPQGELNYHLSAD